MKRLGKLVFAIVFLQLGLYAAGRLAERKAAQDTNPESDEFALVTYFGGKAYSSRASKLRCGSAVTLLGGMNIDLTGAEPDPVGTTLLLKTVLGGVKVTVPAHWHVELMGEASTGDHSLNVTDPSTLPDDAPRLSVITDTRFGGVLVTT